jgi:RNA polymerase sigma-70 factor (ECF subfamily)
MVPAPQPPQPSELDADAAMSPLVARAREGDAEAFDALYQQTKHRVRHVLLQLVGRGPELDDLVQETYLQLVRALRGFRGEARFTTFLHGICANVGLMHLRRRARRPEDVVAEPPDEAAPDSADPERAAAVRDAARLMEAALAALDPKKRLVFVYHDLLGMKPEDIARSLDTGANTVRSRLNRARAEVTVEIARLTRRPLRPGGEHGAT